MAHALGRPCVTGVKAVALEDGALRCEQEVAGGRDVYRVPLPAVVDGQGGAQPAALPVGAGPPAGEEEAARRPTPDRGAQGVEKVRLVVPADEGSQTEVLGRGPDAAPAVVELLDRIGVL